MPPLTPDNDSMERYQILERIAGGGMGRIYRGIKKGIGGFQKPVVLKQLLPELTKDPELVELFFREAQIHATLDHANIVHIIDLVSASNNYYIVMEYVRGTDLYRILKRLKAMRRRLTLDAVLFIAREVLKALDYAHTRTDDSGWLLRVVHRDVSPTNIMVSGAGEVKLTDFGIAKAATHSSNFFRVKGKAAYMSPEQAMGEELDQRTDIFSAAVCFYEMLAGRRPFPAPKIGVPAEEHFRTDVPPASTLRAGCPEELDHIMRQALAVDRRERYQTTTELLTDLEQISARHGLFYSTRKLAACLEQTLGPDPTTWSDLSAKPSSPERASAGSSGRAVAEDDELAFKEPQSSGPDPFSWDEADDAELEDLADLADLAGAADDPDPVGEVATSLSMPPFPWRNRRSEAAPSLPPPKRSSHMSPSLKEPAQSAEPPSPSRSSEHRPIGSPAPRGDLMPPGPGNPQSPPGPPPGLTRPAGVTPRSPVSPPGPVQSQTPPVAGPPESPVATPSQPGRKGPLPAKPKAAAPKPTSPASTPGSGSGPRIRRTSAPPTAPFRPLDRNDPRSQISSPKWLVWAAVGGVLVILGILIFWMVVKAAGT